MSALRKYISLYQSFFMTSLSEAMSFRAHFVLVILVDLFFYASALLSVSFIYDHVPTIGPWSREEFLFFLSFIMVIDHINMTFVSPGYWEFAHDLRLGNLDFVLLKPVGTLFPIFFKRLRVGTLCIFFVPWSLLIYYGIQAELPFSSWFLLPVMVVIGATLMISVGMLIAMGMFWTVEAIGLNFLRMQLQTVSRWPDFVYLHVFRFAFSFILPVLLVGSAPVRFLFDHSAWELLLAMILATIVCCTLISVFWRAGLRRYESASS